MNGARAAIFRFCREEGETLLALLFSRLLIWLIAWLAFHSIRPGELPLDSNGSELWNMLFRWDANWYRSIVEGGYEQQAGQSNLNFFPLYPLCVRFFCAATKLSTPLGGFLVSNGFLVGSVVLLRRLVALDFPSPSRVPARTVWLFLLYPVTFFYSALYTESLYFFLSLGAFLAARKRLWAVAGLTGALLTATRANGLAILLPLAWEAMVETRHYPASALRGILRSRWWLLMVPAGLISFCVFLGIRFGDPLAYVHGMSGWHRGFATPWAGIRAALILYQPTYIRLFLGTEVLAVSVFFLALYLRLRTSYLLYTGALLMVYFSMTLLEAVPRYVSVLFPLQIAVAAFSVRLDEGFYLAVLVANAALMALCLILFSGGYWMT